MDILFVSCCDGEARYQATMQPGQHFDLAKEFVRQGKARFIGFSSHTVPVAMQAVQSGRFSLLMFPINPAFDTLPGVTSADDISNLWEAAYYRQPTDRSEDMLPERMQLYLECASRNISLVAMKPFTAGWLYKPELDTGFYPLNLIHCSLSQPGVSSVIPGVSSCEQLAQNFTYFTASSD